MSRMLLRLSAGICLILLGVSAPFLGSWLGAAPPEKQPVAPSIPTAQPALAASPNLAVQPQEPAKPSPASASSQTRKEVSFRLPVGIFTKEVNAGAYGSCTVTWNYLDNGEVHGEINASVMGVEFRLKTTAEITLSSTGVVHGIVTSANVDHVRVGGERGKAAEGYASLAGLIDAICSDFLVDLPFSYRCQVVGDKLLIRNYRALLAGPNPLNRFNMMQSIFGEDATKYLLYFDALSMAMDGTYRRAHDMRAPERLR